MIKAIDDINFKKPQKKRASYSHSNSKKSKSSLVDLIATNGVASNPKFTKEPVGKSKFRLNVSGKTESDQIINIRVKSLTINNKADDLKVLKSKKKDAEEVKENFQKSNDSEKDAT